MENQSGWQRTLYIVIVCFAEISESFYWTVQPTNPTLVIKGKDVSLTWQFNLTTAEQLKSDNFNVITWKKLNQSSLNYDKIGSRTFVKFIGRPSYDEPRAPHIEIDRNDPATLLINNVRREDEGTYKIEYSIELDGTVLADHEVNVTVLERSEIVYVSNDQDVCEGSTVTLDCNATGKPVPNIKWTRVWENGSDSEELPAVYGYYVDRHISRSSNGKYRCTAYNGVGDPVNRTVEVIIRYSASVVKVIRSSSTVTESDVYNLNCEVSGNPKPQVTWIKVSNDRRSDGNILNFTNIKRNDTGDYRCEASNRCGKNIMTEPINVFYPPSITYISDNKIVNETDVVQLNCTADGNPPPNITWTKVPEISPVPSLLNITGKQKEGLYKCTAENGIGNSATRNVTITVLSYHPLNTKLMTNSSNNSVILNKNFSITCSAEGNPPAKYRIYNEERTIGDNNAVVTTSVTKTVKQVNFSCEPFNDVGVGPVAKISVEVFYPPHKTSEGLDVLQLLEGNPVSHPCPLDGNPPPDFTWYNGNGTSNMKSSGKTLVFVEALLKDSAWYTCSAKNKLGTETTLLHLVVKEKSTTSRTPTTIPASGSKVKEKSTTSSTTSRTPTTLPASGSKEIFLSMTSPASCDRLEEGADKIPKAACDRVRGQGCSSAELLEKSCGSIIVDFMLKFNQSVVGSQVLATLQKAAKNETFGGFKVDPDSIKQIDPPLTTTSPEDINRCECSCKDVLLGSIIGVLLLIIIVLLIYVVWLHKKETAGKQRTYEEERGVYDNEMALKDLDPSQPDSSKFTQPRTEYMDLKETRPDNTKTQSSGQAADYAPLHPLTRSWEVARNHVTIEKIIGKGAFGQVAKGTAVELRGRPGTTTVAIKMLKYNAAESDKKDLMKELHTMKQLKPHPHVIKLLGCVTESETLLVLIEYVPYGDLLGYLRKSRGLNDTYYKDPDIKPQTNLTSQQLMKFAWQIADGMSYLSSKSIIHRDLAARNVLVGEKETCKVTDFGMARDVQQENIYERKTKGRLPVKWTAYEALLYGTYTTKSDIWSYGVVLYEIFTIGGSPYPRMDGRKIANLLQEGYRMPKPQHVDDKLYQIMMSCWQNNPDARPTFTDLKTQLKDMEALHKRLINMKMYDKQLYANVEDLVV